MISSARVYKSLLAAGAIIACLSAMPSFAAEKTPAQWVKQLGGDRLTDRDKATAALLALGDKARDAVREALNSADPEIKSRAQELWKTLRWKLIPGAEEEIAKLTPTTARDRNEPEPRLPGILDDIAMEEPRHEPGGLIHPEDDEFTNNEEAWDAFVRKHGAESLRVTAEFRSAGFRAKTYRGGVNAVLQFTRTEEIMRVIAAHPAEKVALVSQFDEVNPGASIWCGAPLVRLRNALGEYDKAYEFGRTAAFQHNSEEFTADCAISVERGGLFEKVNAEGLKVIAAETDPEKLCVKLNFFTGIMVAIGKKECVSPLCDAMGGADLLAAWEESLHMLVSTLLKAGMPARAALILHDAKKPVTLYMRAHVNTEMHETAAADTDWTAAQAAADAIVDEQEKKAAYYEIGELMKDWHDPRAETLWQKILTLPPANTVYDTNVCFRLAELYESRKKFAEAASRYEQALDFAAKAGGELLVTNSDGSTADDGAAVIRDQIKKLKALATTPGKNP